jgi:hypothetical protein
MNFTKYIFLFLTVYSLISVVFGILDENKYFYKKGNHFQAVATTFLQPFMNVFGNSKVTHFWHFKNLSPEEISNLKNTEPLLLKSKKLLENLIITLWA